MYRTTLRIAAEAVGFAAGPNGVSLVAEDDGSMASFVLAIDPWIVPEGNVLDLRVFPVPAGEGRRGRLQVAIGGPPQGSSTPRFAFLWEHEGPPFEPFRIALPFEPAEAPDTLAFTRAERFERLSDEDLAGARACGMALVEAFRAKDAAAISRLLETRDRDLASAGGSPLAEYRARVKKAYDEVLAEGPVAPVAAAEISARLVAGGRVVHLTASGHELVDGPESAIPVYVSRIDGRWVVSR